MTITRIELTLLASFGLALSAGYASAQTTRTEPTVIPRHEFQQGTPPSPPRLPVQQKQSMRPDARQEGTLLANEVGAKWQASKLIGSPVQDRQGVALGEVQDLIVDASGRVSAVVLGVPNQLGFGERQVAVDMKALDRRPDGSLEMDARREALQSAPVWAPAQ